MDITYLCTSICEENNVIILMFRNTSLLTRLASPVDTIQVQVQYQDEYINKYNTRIVQIQAQLANKVDTK